jgi:hypothetical protein
MSDVVRRWVSEGLATGVPTDLSELGPPLKRPALNPLLLMSSA